MKTSDAWELSKTITSGMHFGRGIGGGWSFYDSDRHDLRWSTDLLGRIILLIGNEDVVFNSGFVTEEEHISGEIIVLTVSRIIRATFKVAPQEGGPRSGLKLVANVSAQRRSSIESVEVLSASLLDSDPNAEWPKRFSVRMTMKDETSILLPLTGPIRDFDEFRTAEVVSELLLTQQ